MNTLAIINIAKKDLAMEDDDYRALLLRVGGTASLRTMSERGRLKVVDEMKRLGFKVKPRGGKPLPASTKPYIRLIHALWKSCARKGVVSDASRPALRTFVENRSGVSDPDFLTFEQASPIIDALKAMEARR